MSKRTTFAVLAGLLAATLLPVGCSDAVSPERRGPTAPLFAFSASGITLDQQNGALNQSGTQIIKGFNPTNPHLGDAIVATFYWLGSTNIIDSVTDVLTTTPFTPVGNTYTLVEYVTAGGISMATYVATNVQNFPDPNPPNELVLAVRANLSLPVLDGGVKISAWIGVEDVFAQAVGAHRSASALGTTPTTVGPGPITVGAGGLAYAVTMANGGVGLLSTPAGFTSLGGFGSDAVIQEDGRYRVSASQETVDPRWTWDFARPSTALATVLALNAAPPPPPTHLVFTVQPSNTTAGGTISPAVQVAAQDDGGNTVTGFSGAITIALGNNPGGGTLSGTTTVTAVNGVATFSNLSIDQAGTGYTLVATTPGLTGATSAPFNITPRLATHLVFTVQPTNTTAGSTISPAVRVAAQDDAGNTVTSFSGTITIALGTNPAGGTLSGTTTVTAVNGVATFSNLSIDRAGNGYTLVATAAGLTGATSAPFNITAVPQQARAQVSGGGRIDPSSGKTTFGFNVDGRSGSSFQGETEVVYHGGTSGMTRIHSSFIDGMTTSSDSRGGVCVTWTGSARVDNGAQRRFTATACDNGQPNGSAGPDRFGITVDGTISIGLTDLKGGNTQARQ